MDTLAELTEKKKALSRRFLGHAGIHGFSTDPDRLVIRVFVAKSNMPKEALEELREVYVQALPFLVEVVTSGAPGIEDR